MRTTYSVRMARLIKLKHLYVRARVETGAMHRTLISRDQSSNLFHPMLDDVSIHLLVDCSLFIQKTPLYFNLSVSWPLLIISQQEELGGKKKRKIHLTSDQTIILTKDNTSMP